MKKNYRKELIGSDGSNGQTFYTFIARHITGNGLLLVSARWQFLLILYYDKAEASYRGLYVTSKFRRRSRKIDSRQEAWREQTFFPVATFAINRAYVGSIVVIFSIAISPSPPHFPGAVFLERYLTSRSLSVVVCTTALTLQAQRIAAESCDSRKIAIAGSARGKRAADLS